MAIGASRRALKRGSRLLLAVLWLLLAVAAGATAPSVAHADGGAPNLVYVAGGGAGGGDLVIIDIAQRKVTGRVHIGGDLRSVMLSLDNRIAYVTCMSADSVAIVDASAKKVVRNLPVGHGPIALAADTYRTGDLFVAENGSDAVAVLDPIASKVVATIPVGKHPTGLAVAGPGAGISDANDAEVYVTNADSDSVSVISAAHRTVIAEIPVPGGPLSVVVPAAGGVAYVGTRAGAIVVVGLADHRVLGTLLQLRGSAAGAMDYDALTSEVYVPDATAGAVSVLAPASAGGAGQAPNLPHEPARVLPFAGGPAAVAITFDGSYGFVAEHDAGRVVMFDVAEHKTLATLSIGGTPQALVTGSYPPLLSQQSADVAGIISYIVLGAIVLGAVGYYFMASRRRPAGTGETKG